MEYKINNFNLSDINFADLKSLSDYFEISIPKQKINNILLGPNLLNISNPLNEKHKKTPEDKKLLSSLSRLIISSQSHKLDQTVLITTNSYSNTKVFLKRILKQLGLLSLGTTNDKNKIDQVINEIKQSLPLLDFISYFTLIKQPGGDDIPITDYDLTFVNDSSVGIPGIKLTNINFRLFNYEIIAMKTEPKTQLMNISNINFLYMLLYNIPLKDLCTYLYCDITKEYFNIFDEEIELQDYVRRYVLINQLKLTKTESQYEVFAKENENYNKIQKEYDYYYNLYIQYQKIKTDLMITEQFEQKLIGLYFGMILIAEFDIMNDQLYSIINRELKNSYSNSSIDLFTFIRNIVLNDERFKYIQTKEQNNSRIESESILSKIALNISISEERILYLLITDLVKKGKGKVNQTKEAIEANCQQMIIILYQLSIDRIKSYIDSHIIHKSKKALSSPHIRKVQFIISRSNLIYEYSFKHYALKACPYYSINSSSDMKSFDDNKTYIISQNVKELIVSNYLQELKNYIYITQSMAISCNTKEYNWPKIDYNEEYISKLLNENYHFDYIINLYENQQCGLIKMVNEMSYDDTSSNSSTTSIGGGSGSGINNTTKEEMSFNVFKAHLDSLIGKKRSIVQIVELFNTEAQLYQTFIQVKHSFGTFLYDLNAIFFNKTRISSIKEQTIYKFFDYKPSYIENYFRYNEEMTHKLLKKLSISNLFICDVIKFSNAYSTMTILDDFKLNNIYFFYSNFFNYILNIKEIKESLIKSKTLQLTHSMIKDDMILFKFICKRLRFSISDNYYRNGYIYSKTKLSRAMDNNKNISSIVFKYNPQLFNYLFLKKITSSKFKYFVFIVNCVKTFVKLTKIYNEKKVLSNVRNLLTDVIVDNYEILDNENKKLKHNLESPCNINKINQTFLPKIDQLSELVFDFNKEALSKILPKLRSNLAKLKRIWKDYVSDIKYLELNKHNFYNKRSTQIVIEQRLVNFQILLFLFSKKYKFINSESVMKYGVLLTEFTKTISTEVLTLLSELDREFHLFLEDNDLNIIENTDNSKLEGLIAKRIELQKEIKQQSQLSNFSHNHSHSEHSNSVREDKKKIEKEIVYDDAFDRVMSNIQENHHPNNNNRNSNLNENNYDLKNNLSFKDLKNHTYSKEEYNENNDKKEDYYNCNCNRNDNDNEIKMSSERGSGNLKTNKENEGNDNSNNTNTSKGKYEKFIQGTSVYNQQFINTFPIPSNKIISDDNNKDIQSLNQKKNDGIDKDNRQENKRNIIVDFREELINANIQKAEEERIGRNKINSYQDEKRSEAFITGSDSLSKIVGYNEKSKGLVSTSSNNNIEVYNLKHKNSNYNRINDEIEENQERDSDKRGDSNSIPSNLNINIMIDNKLKATKGNPHNQKKNIDTDLFAKLDSNDSKRSLGNTNNNNRKMLLKDINENSDCNENAEVNNEEIDLDYNKGNPFINEAIEDNNNNDHGRNDNDEFNKDKEQIQKESIKETQREDSLKEESIKVNELKLETPKKDPSKIRELRQYIPRSDSSGRRTKKKDLLYQEESNDNVDDNNDNEDIIKIEKNSSKGQQSLKRRIDIDTNQDNRYQSEDYNYHFNNNEEEEGEYEEEMNYSPDKETQYQYQNQYNEHEDYQDQDQGEEMIQSSLRNSEKTYQLGTEEKIGIMHSYTNPYIEMSDKPILEYSTYTPETQILSSVPLQIPLLNEKRNDIIQSLIKSSNSDKVQTIQTTHIDLQLNQYKKKENEEGEEEQKEIIVQPTQTLSLPALKELDDKISQLKKELNGLEVMGRISEKTSLLLFANDDIKDDQLMKEEAEKIDKEFYDDIEEKLKLAEKAIKSQFL